MEFKNDYTILEEVDFFDLMQNYRIAHQGNQENVIKKYSDVKDFIKENFVPKNQLNESANEMFEQLKSMREAILSDDYVRMLAESQKTKELLTKITE